MNSYIEWLKIIGLAIGLMNTVIFNDSFYITQKWINLKELSIESHDADSALVIKFKLKGNYPQEVSKTIVLVPCVDLYPKLSENSIMMPILYTVTKNALVFQYQESDTVEKTLQETGLIKSLDTLFNYDINQTQETNTADRIPSGYQVLKFKSFPNYAEIEIAKPGSRPVVLKEFAEVFKDKMIHVSVIPDMGNVMSFWIKGKTDTINDVNLLQDKISSELSACQKNPTEENRNKAYLNTMSFIRNTFSRDTATYYANIKYYEDLIMRFLLIRKKLILYPIQDEIFGDYQSKLTPDSAKDYMPIIAGAFDSLPAATEENFVLLVREFLTYQKAASKNKGEWVEGNIVLGAKPKEYKPTKDELILNEIGNRMNKIIQNSDYKILKKKLKKAGIKQDKFEYTNFTFIHVDVMGSGRFIYVEKMNKVCLTITK